VGGTYQAVAPTAIPQNSGKFSDITVGGKYKIYLVTGDSLAGTVTSMDDTSVVFDTDGRRPYTFRTVLIKKYEVVALPAQSSLQPAAVISPPSGEATPLSYEDLFSVTMKGKTIEITTRNGSFFKGTLMSVGPDIARLSVDGMEVPISRKMITKIALLSK
jgi:ribosome maturation factor RimP